MLSSKGAKNIHLKNLAEILCKPSFEQQLFFFKLQQPVKECMQLANIRFI